MTDRDFFSISDFISVSLELDRVGLQWQPEIGDEVADRGDLGHVSILVDPQGLTPAELRETFVWLPTVEQLVEQFETRHAQIYHAGVDDTAQYRVVIKSSAGMIEESACSLRVALGRALQDLLQGATTNSYVH